MTSPADPPQTLKEGRSPIIQSRGQSRARKRAKAEEGWRKAESTDIQMSPTLIPCPDSQYPQISE